MSEPTYIDRLRSALSDAGIGGARRDRIVAEFADHLSESPSAELGDPAQIAAQFADELGTTLARRAALTAFAALAVTGAILAVRLLTMGAFYRVDGSTPDTLGLLATVLAGQIAFAAGTLALLRALRLRHRITVPAAEARILARRTAVALVAGALTILAVPLRASATPHATSGATWLSSAAEVLALLILLSAVPALVRAARVQPQTAGAAGDLFDDLDDLGPLGSLARRIGTPTRFALLFAVALATVIALAGIAADDPYDGILRGLLEGGACLTGFAVLGPALGLK